MSETIKNEIKIVYHLCPRALGSGNLSRGGGESSLSRLRGGPPIIGDLGPGPIPLLRIPTGDASLLLLSDGGGDLSRPLYRPSIRGGDLAR